MGGRVTDIHAHRVAAVPALNREHPGRDVVERLVPVHTLPSPCSAAQGMADAIRVGVHVLQRVALGTDVPA